MTATKYLRASKTDPAGGAVDRPCPRGLAGVGFLPRVILPPEPQKRPMGIRGVAGALVAALCALVLGGLGWLAAGVF